MHPDLYNSTGLRAVADLADDLGLRTTDADEVVEQVADFERLLALLDDRAAQPGQAIDLIQNPDAVDRLSHAVGELLRRQRDRAAALDHEARLREVQRLQANWGRASDSRPGRQAVLLILLAALLEATQTLSGKSEDLLHSRRR